MSEQALKRLVGALVILVALWGITSLISSDGSGSRAASGEIAGVLDGVSETSVERVRMTTLAGSIDLARTDGAWRVNDFPADSGVVTGFWRVATGLAIGDLIAANPDNHERMGITDGAAWTLEFTVGGETRTILVGGQGPGFATSYVRLPGSDDVYLLEGDVRAHIRRPLDQWRNKLLASIDTAAVVRLEVERGGDAYVLLRAAEAWTFESGEAARAVTVQNLLTDLRHLEASGILAETDSLAAAAEGGSLLAYDGGGAVLAELHVGAGEGDRWVRAAGDDTVYRLASFRMDRLFPRRETVLPEQ
ncbi:MAG: DUF4340 domain-containing protein [Gemmatimonadetes bacterium]|nr:DUF4340 domain-containing protein [Gemmatimonadota bacterium]